MRTNSYIEISRSALENNYTFLRELVKEGVQISSVVKGNAYGHGISCFVPLAEKCGMRHFSTFSADEAYQVAKSLTKDSTILIMGMLDNDQLEWAIQNDIEFFVFERDRLVHAIKVARKIHKKAIVHLELETGMNRTGIYPEDIESILDIIQEHNDAVEFKGLCTHFAGAESIANYYRIKRQKVNFLRAIRSLEKNKMRPELVHAACSAATVRYPETHFDMVRLGILQYGFWPTREVQIEYFKQDDEVSNPLRRLISWKTEVMDVRRVAKGEYIGYGTSYLANNPMTVAAIPVGYSHGFSRSLSNQGRVLIHGQRVAVVGMVNMNMMLVDVSRIPHVHKGDEVVLIGRQGDMEISVSSFAEFSDQVNYEMLTRLPSGIPRVVVE